MREKEAAVLEQADAKCGCGEVNVDSVHMMLTCPAMESARVNFSVQEAPAEAAAHFVRLTRTPVCRKAGSLLAVAGT